MKISVDYKRLGNAAKEIDGYVTRHKKIMSDINADVDFLNKDWQGADYDRLRKEWKQIKGEDSTSYNMIRALEEYAEFLRFAESKYKSAQVNAINRANNISRGW